MAGSASKKRMYNHSWKSYFAREFWVGDYDLASTGHIIRLSNGIVKEVFYTTHDGKSETWMREDEWEMFLTSLGKEVLENDWSLHNHLAQFHEARSNVEKMVNEVARVAPTATVKQCADLYELLHEAFYPFSYFVWFPWGITYFLEQWMQERLEAKYGEWQQMIEVIGRSPRQIQMDQMIDAVCEWHVAGKPDADLHPIADMYGHLGVYSVLHKPWSAQEVKERAQPLDRCRLRLENGPKEQKETIRAFNQLLKQIQADDPQLANAVETTHEYTWLRTERIDVFKWALLRIQPLHHRVEELVGWEPGWAAHLAASEMKAVLHGQLVIDRDELERRSTLQYAVHTTNNGTVVTSDPKNRELVIQNLLGLQEYGKVELRGNTACPGVIEGIVRVIMRTEQVREFQQGEVLVANMTHPDYMPAILKAAALVTDEGGIVCHAAVISRERNIPCIIATGDATKVLQTGDRVLVDANTGTIKILK